VREATIPKGMPADRLAGEVARLAEERIRAMSPFAEQKPWDEK
jgi:hypothetical protein